MRVGIYYDFSFSDRSPVDRLWPLLREQVAAADDLGFDSAWFAERHFVDDAPGAAHILLGHLAKATRAIRLGSFQVLPVENPVRTAENFAVVDLLSGGRSNLGVTVGSDPACDRAWKIERREREARLWEALDVVRAAWTSDEFQYRGRHHRFPAHLAPRPDAPYAAAEHGAAYVPQWERGPDVPEFLAVTPKPLQEPHPPIWVLAADAALAAEAARRGLSCVLPEDLGSSALTGAAEGFWRALSRAGRARHEATVACIRDVALGGRPYGASSTTIGGTSADVVVALKRLQNETGLGHLLWRIPFPAVGHDEVIEWLRRFASEIQPTLQS